jgi:L-amino acid N-acyltransferase YncA
MGNDNERDEEISIRRARPEDRAEILEVCRVSLGWDESDPNESFFEWKHDHNAFGPSPTWVAETPDGRILGVRCFMRWRFRDAAGAPVEAVRAVDTATHPDARGRGLFTRLTLGALPELTEEQVQFVFNTPNEKSRPGYLKMGWSLVGQVPLGVRPSSLRVRRSGGDWSGSDKWGEPTDVGLTPEEALADHDEVERLVRSLAPTTRLSTDRSPEFLRWRYGFSPLNYRVLPVGDSIRDGAVVFRLRRRGGRLDATICEELLPRRSDTRSVMSRLARATHADLVLRNQRTAWGPGRFVRVRRLGPLLTWKPLAREGTPTLDDLDLTYGDLELF